MRVLIARVLILVSLLAPIPLLQAERAPALERSSVAQPSVARLGDVGSRGNRQRGGRAHKPFRHPGGDEDLVRGKNQPSLSGPSERAETARPGPLVAAPGFDGIGDTGFIPPDGAIAVSNTFLVAAVNTSVSVWRKSYDLNGNLSAVSLAVPATDLDPFFSANPGCLTPTNDSFFGFSFGGLSDPSADYDAVNDRFMLSMISFDQLTFDSSVCVAVSATGDPTGNWYVYAFPISPSGALLDFPRAVIGTDAIYLAGNVFLNGASTFDRARVYALDKRTMYAGAGTSYTYAVVGNDPETGQPADSLAPARAVAGPGMYLLSAASTNCTTLLSCAGTTINLWKWSWSGVPFQSTFSLTHQGSVSVDPYHQPPDAYQPGSANCSTPGAAGCIATNDWRNLSAYWFNNTVYGTHATGCTSSLTETCVQWYQLGNLDPLPGTVPTLLNQHTIWSANQNRFFPSLAVDGNGNLGLGYAYSSPTDNAGIRYTVDGTLGGEGLLRAGVGFVDGTRYGDFAGTVVDPHDNITFWHFEEYAADPSGGGLWGTWVGPFQVSAAPPPTFSIQAGSPSPTAVPPGASDSYLVTVSPLNGFTGTVVLSAVGPSGTNGSFSPASLTFAGGAPPATSTLTVAAGATLRGGNYTLTLTATGGGMTHTTAVTLSVMDFSISVSPSSKTVLRGGSAQYTVTVNPTNGYSLPVAFTAVSGLPGGVSYSPNPLPSAVIPGTTFPLTVKTSSITRRNTYTLTITATGPGGSTTLTRRTTFQLRVR